jgi:hypothetical protein
VVRTHTVRENKAENGKKVTLHIDPYRLSQQPGSLFCHSFFALLFFFDMEMGREGETRKRGRCDRSAQAGTRHKTQRHSTLLNRHAARITHHTQLDAAAVAAAAAASTITQTHTDKPRARPSEISATAPSLPPLLPFMICLEGHLNTHTHTHTHTHTRQHKVCQTFVLSSLEG